MATSKKDSMTAVAKKANRDYPLAESPNPGKFFTGIGNVIEKARSNRAANILARAELKKAKREGKANIIKAKGQKKLNKMGYTTE